jgi:hypothetical protein
MFSRKIVVSYSCLLAYRLEILIVNFRKLIIEVICCEGFMLHV